VVEGVLAARLGRRGERIRGAVFRVAE